MTSIRRSTLAVALAVITLATTAFQCGGGNTPQEQVSLQQRAIRAVAVVPSFVRIVAPNLSPNILAVIDAGVGTFSDFQANPTANRWKIATDAWRNRVVPELRKLNNSKVEIAIAAAELLLTQVIIVEPSPPPLGSMAAPSPARVETKFTKKAVEDLEKALQP